MRSGRRRLDLAAVSLEPWSYIQQALDIEDLRNWWSPSYAGRLPGGAALGRHHRRNLGVAAWATSWLSRVDYFDLGVGASASSSRQKSSWRRLRRRGAKSRTVERNRRSSVAFAFGSARAQQAAAVIFADRTAHFLRRFQTEAAASQAIPDRLFRQFPNDERFDDAPKSRD